MLEALFGGKAKEQVLQYILARDKGYIREIASFYGISPNSVKNQIDRLESGGIIVGVKIGNMRIYSLNERYFLYKEIVMLLEKARQAYASDLQERLLDRGRTRPRKKDKPYVKKCKQ